MHPSNVNNTTSNEHAEAWAFVLARSNQIDRLARKFLSKLCEADYEDARSEYITRIVEQYPRLRLADARNPEAVIVTWLGWQAIAVRQTFCRSFKKRIKEGTSEPKVLVTVMCQGAGSHEAMDRALTQHSAVEEVERLFSRADHRQQEAMVTVLAEMTPAEMRTRYGLSPAARNARIASIGAQPLRALR